MARESTVALDHQQPTPESPARAGRRLDDGTAGENALAGLARARKVDVAGDAAACELAVAAARNVLGHWLRRPSTVSLPHGASGACKLRPRSNVLDGVPFDSR